MQYATAFLHMAHLTLVVQKIIYNKWLASIQNWEKRISNCGSILTVIY